MLNHITVMGRLTRDVELRRTGSGIAVANFSIACERDVKGQDGEKVTDFFDCVAWRQTGEFVSKYFRKGNMIVVSGRLETRSWSDKDGNKRKSVEINAFNAYFGESKRESGGSNVSGSYGGNAFPEATEAIGRYTQQPINPGAEDYALLEDDDAQLPF